MRIFGLAGWSGSGKTTLLTRADSGAGRARPHRVDVKHAHHEFDVDQPGKDSWRHREAGATRGDGRLGAALGADARASRRAGSRRSTSWCAHMSAGRSGARRRLQARSRIPSSRSTGRSLGKPLLVPRRSRISSRSPATRRSPASPCRCCRSTMRRRSPTSSSRISASRRRDMAQLSDDCFAFGGDLLSIDAALALIEAQVTPRSSRARPCRSRRRAGRILAAPLRGAARRAAARQ